MKTIRIILSPLLFISIFFAMLVIPLGPMALFMGSVDALYKILKKQPVEDVDMIFAWFTLPYYETEKFISNT